MHGWTFGHRASARYDSASHWGVAALRLKSLVDVPAVFAVDKLASKIPMTLVHTIAAGVFALLGVATLLGAGAKLDF